MSKCKELCSRLWNEEDAAAMVEYALMLALIASVCLAAISHVGANASEVFQEIADQLE